MKRTLSVAPIRLGKYIAETWHIPVKPARRAARSVGAHNRRHLILPGDPHFIVCSFCGNTIRVVVSATHKGGRK